MRSRRALANGDDYARRLLREQLQAEEQERPIDILKPEE